MSMAYRPAAIVVSVIGERGSADFTYPKATMRPRRAL